MVTDFAARTSDSTSRFAALPSGVSICVVRRPAGARRLALSAFAPGQHCVLTISALPRSVRAVEAAQPQLHAHCSVSKACSLSRCYRRASVLQTTSFAENQGPATGGRAARNASDPILRLIAELRNRGRLVQEDVLGDEPAGFVVATHPRAIDLLLSHEQRLPHRAQKLGVSPGNLG